MRRADNRKLFTGLGLKDFIMRKGARGKNLTEYQKKMNKSISKVGAIQLGKYLGY